MQMTKTKVLFVIDEPGGDVTAVFPYEEHGFNGYRNDLCICYAHIGQHSACAPEYYQPLKLANKEQYQELYNELISIGYDLIIMKRKPRMK